MQGRYMWGCLNFYHSLLQRPVVEGHVAIVVLYDPCEILATKLQLSEFYLVNYSGRGGEGEMMINFSFFSLFICNRAE